jgi:HEPN domain-containing protein
MTPDNLPRKEAAKWLNEAAKDRHAASVLLDVEPSRSVFFSQQAAEKAAKAFLTFHQIAFRKTHDLTYLGTQCATADISLEPALKEAEELTDYASVFRYPDAPYEPDRPEALRAIEIADKLCAAVRVRLEGGEPELQPETPDVMVAPSTPPEEG